jgi:hypothetical protein
MTYCKELSGKIEQDDISETPATHLPITCLAITLLWISEVPS